MEHQQTVEQTLRDAGWIEIKTNDLRPGEFGYSTEHQLTIPHSAKDYWSDTAVLVHPNRPTEPILPGTQARIEIPSDHSGESSRTVNALHTDSKNWITSNGCMYNNQQVKVLRIITLPDGTDAQVQKKLAARAAARKTEAPTLKSIRKTGRTAIDHHDQRWHWEAKNMRFVTSFGRGGNTWSADGLSLTQAATREDYFVRWEDED